MSPATVASPSTSGAARRRPVIPSGVFGTLIFVFTELMLFMGMISAFMIVRSSTTAGKADKQQNQADHQRSHPDRSANQGHRDHPRRGQSQILRSDLPRSARFAKGRGQTHVSSDTTRQGRQHGQDD